jgi:hypothetical protein
MAAVANNCFGMFERHGDGREVVYKMFTEDMKS